MRERPILFSAPMVRAILDGKKTQTRRVVKPRRYEGCSNECVPDYEHAHPDPGLGAGGYLHVPCQHGASQRERCVHQIGDRMWVREAWRFEGTDMMRFGRTHRVQDGVVRYLADNERRTITTDWRDVEVWMARRLMNRPGIHMPRWASRLTLEVTGVRVERLQAISEDDAKAEGVDRDPTPVLDDDREDPREVGYPSAGDFARAEATQHRRWFRALWESIHGPGAWDANPWVWAVEFKRVEVAA